MTLIKTDATKIPKHFQEHSHLLFSTNHNMNEKSNKLSLFHSSHHLTHMKISNGWNTCIFQDISGNMSLLYIFLKNMSLSCVYVFMSLVSCLYITENTLASNFPVNFNSAG